MEKVIPFVVFGLIAWASGIFGPSPKQKALAKARAAKKRLQKLRGRVKRRARKGKSFLYRQRLRNLAKARAARRKKSKAK